MKKYIIKYAVMACLSLGLTGTTASCTDYLDKAPESDVTPENAFKDFHNFQGICRRALCLYSRHGQTILVKLLELG